MNDIVCSKEVTKEVEDRAKSPIREKQVAKLSINSAFRQTLVADVLLEAVKLGLVSLNFPLIQAGELLFKGTEAEVLEQIRQVPLPREGKKGTSRTALVKMTVLRIDWIKKLAKRQPTADELVRLCLMFKQAHERAQATNTYVTETKNKEIFKKVGLKLESYFDYGRVFDIFTFSIRPDVDEALLREGYDLWQVGQVHQE
jgi:hypothetical protein